MPSFLHLIHHSGVKAESHLPSPVTQLSKPPPPPPPPTPRLLIYVSLITLGPLNSNQFGGGREHLGGQGCFSHATLVLAVPGTQGLHQHKLSVETGLLQAALAVEHSSCTSTGRSSSQLFSGFYFFPSRPLPWPPSCPLLWRQ